MRFIWTDDRGYINPAHIIAIAPAPNTHGKRARITYLNGADVATATAPCNKDVDAFAGEVARGLHRPTVVPAAPGTRVVALWGAHLPEPEPLVVSVQPVIAWELEHDDDREGSSLSPVPVLVDPADYFGLITESGSVIGGGCDIGSGTYPGETEYIVAVQAAFAARRKRMREWLEARDAKALIG
jgi:hypothetical protein